LPRLHRSAQKLLIPAIGLLFATCSAPRAGVWRHGRHVYDEFVRIPCVLRIPGADGLAGRRIPSLVSLVDVLPTFLDLLEIVPPDGMQGMSLLPLLAGRAEGFASREVFLRNTHGDVPEFGVRKGRYKWIYKVYEGRYECYDLIEDPLERRDLVAADRIPQEIATDYEKIALWIATGTEQVEAGRELDAKTREQLQAIGYF